MRICFSVLVLSLLVSSALLAQNVTMGVLQFQAGGTIPSSGFTFIDTTHPATADGTITNVAIRWLADNSCSGAYKVRVYRYSNDGGSLTMVGESPALDATAGNGLVLGSFPAMAVKKGDLLAIAQTGGQGCGGVTFSNSANAADTVYMFGNAFTGGQIGGQMFHHMRLDAVAGNAPQHLVGVVPVVGAVQGAGAFFRSSLQLANPTNWPINGTLVYHPAGKSGTSSDPSLAFHVDPHGSVSYADIATTMGQSGIGSLDVFSDGTPPETTARVFNDVGAAGTYGLTEDLVTPWSMFDTNVQFFTIPIAADLTNFRVNLGVRTLDTPTSIGISLYDANGKLLNLGSASIMNYDPNYFEQVTLGQFLANFTTVAPPAGGTIQVYVNSGGPIVFYTSTLDNRTKDSDLKMITPR